jgi:hypothetical protein
MLHTVAYALNNTNPAAKVNTPALFPVPTVQDPFFSASGTTAFLLPSDMKLVAAYATSASLQRARINSPSLLRVGFPLIRPIQVSPTDLPPTDPNFMLLNTNEVHFPAGEPVGIDTTTQNGQENIIVALLWFVHCGEGHSGHHGGEEHHHEGGHSLHHPQHHHLHHLPPGDSFWLRYVPADTAPVTPFRWTQVTPVFDQTLPSGTYAVIGFEHSGPSVVGARLNFPGQVFRPGVVGQTTPGGRTNWAFYNGTFGLYGVFRTIAPPSVEVLTVTQNPQQPGDIPNQTHEGYVRVVRLGDVDMPLGPHHASGYGVAPPPGPMGRAIGQHPHAQSPMHRGGGPGHGHGPLGHPHGYGPRNMG